MRKTDIFMDLINQNKIPLRPGVLRVIDEAIAAGVRLAVCSTSNEKAVTNLVNTLMGPQRASYFQIFAGDMVQNKKVRANHVVHECVTRKPDLYTAMYFCIIHIARSRCILDGG